MLDQTNIKNTKNIVFASLLTGIYDVNRNEILKSNDFKIIQKWYDSVVKLRLNAVIFHNNFSDDIVKKYTTDCIQFVDIEYNSEFNPNIFRYFIYQDYLDQHINQIDNVFVTDITDVEIIINPFESNFYIENKDCLFCGDEPKILDNEWMKNHCSHLRNSIPEFVNYEIANQHQTLLNCGIIGGNKNVMKLLFKEITTLHQTYSLTNTTAYTLDMGVFNYVARTIFKHKICHGFPVNTIFKEYQSQRIDCWFRHK